MNCFLHRDCQSPPHRRNGVDSWPIQNQSKPFGQPVVKCEFRRAKVCEETVLGHVVQGIAFARQGRGRKCCVRERRALIIGHVGYAQALDELFLASGLPKSST